MKNFNHSAEIKINTEIPTQHRAKKIISPPNYSRGNMNAFPAAVTVAKDLQVDRRAQQHHPTCWMVSKR